MSSDVTFSARKIKFIDWLACPKSDRKPATQDQLAEEIGVSARTLIRWKKMPELQDEVRQRTRELLGNDLPDIYGALRQKAKEGSYQHIRLAMELTGEYVERKEISGAGGGPVVLRYEGNLPPDEL